jgi:3-hydroxyacyl-CoA dehydrogenase/enoyl-CoA hydratase/3-hydroxybutyryl-CoA epimerase
MTVETINRAVQWSLDVATDASGAAAEPCALIVTIDVPGKSVNAIDRKVLEELDAAVAHIEQSRPSAVIFRSGKAKNFIAGADLFDIARLNGDEVRQFVEHAQSVFQRIAKLSMPTVAAINGDCLGGGLELALACKARVAVDDASISIGLPEVKIGLIPGWGGCTRLPRLVGLSRALPLILAGKTLPPRKAQKAGIVDEVVRREALLSAARRVAHDLPRRPKLHWIDRLAQRVPFVAHRILHRATEMTRRQTHGHYPAPEKVIGVISAGWGRDVASGLLAEAAAITELANSPTTRSLMRVFFLRQAARKRAGRGLTTEPIDVTNAAVVGGGVMGSGIAHALVRAGVQVRLIDLDAAAVSAGLGRVQRLLDEDVRSGRLLPLDAKHAMSRVSPSVGLSGLGAVDLAIEAVVEKIEVKREVFATLDRLCHPRAILASNTSSLSIAEMAAATKRPGRVIGLHFFNPVAKMPLLEIVRTDQTDDLSIVTAVTLAGRIGKTPLLVRDSPGFVVNRILIPYLMAAQRMLEQGVGIPETDRAMVDWGMPMGPFELLDEIGLDVALKVMESLARTGEEGGTAGVVNIPSVLREAVSRNWLGKKTGQGFYIYPRKPSRRARPWVHQLLLDTGGIKSGLKKMPEADIQRELIDPMVAEAKALLAEGVVESADDIDLAVVLGLGLAPFRGGLMQFAESMESKDAVTEKQRMGCVA